MRRRGGREGKKTGGHGGPPLQEIFQCGSVRSPRQEIFQCGSVRSPRQEIFQCGSVSMCEDSGGHAKARRRKEIFTRRHGGTEENMGKKKRIPCLSVFFFFASLREHFGRFHAKARRREGVRDFSHGGTGGMTKGIIRGAKWGQPAGRIAPGARGGYYWGRA